MRVVILTGLSGSGKSTAARALEDDGFFVVDNLPPLLLPRFLELNASGPAPREDLAVVIDARSLGFLTGLDQRLAALHSAGHDLAIYFFDAEDEALVRRFSETRRRHPLAKSDAVLDGIRRERELLAPLRDRAEHLIDTTRLTPHQLRERIVRLVRGNSEPAPLVVFLQSFGFRYGIPTGSDVVMDVRFLPNPHFVPELRPLSGLDPAVRDYVLAQPVCREFMDKFRDLLHFLLPQYQREGKSYLTIAVGCTGGRHRSVAIVDELSRILRDEPVELRVLQRDVDKG